MPHIDRAIEIAANIEPVYALAKDVEQFPEFMPDLEAVTILERDGGHTVSQWQGRIKQFNRAIKWTEEDWWDDAAKTCRFEQTEGDFTAYSGVWRFEPTGPGTKALLSIDYEYDVPLVGKIIQGVLLKLVRQNCQNMLDALKGKCETG